MLQKFDKDRLDKVLGVIETLNIRFPVAEISRKLKADKGMVSAYLAGKKPISDNFYSSFMQMFSTQPKQLKEIFIENANIGKVVSRLLEITIKQQAEINLLKKALTGFSVKDVSEEYERIFDEYANLQ